jgi:hypothetical protein
MQAEVGVDAGAYARQLMGHAREEADDVTLPSHPQFQAAAASLASPSSTSVAGSSSSSGAGGQSNMDRSSGSTAVPLQQDILERAYFQTDVRGACSVCDCVYVFYF